MKHRPQKALIALSRRRDRILTELRLVERKLAALQAFVGFCDDRTYAHERIEAMLCENPEIQFTPAEIGEVCRLTEHALRAALKRSYRSGLIRKVGHARYQAPLRGPTVIP